MKLLNPYFIILILCFTSCVKEVDFNQIDDAEINSNLLLTFVHFNLKGSDFSSDNGNEYVITDTVQLPINEGFEEYLSKVVFEIDSENSFDSGFKIEVVFLDEDKTPFYKLSPTIVIPLGSENLATIIEIPQEDMFNVFQMEYISFLVSKDPGSSNSTDSSNLVLKSSMELFFKFTTE